MQLLYVSRHPAQAEAVWQRLNLLMFCISSLTGPCRYGRQKRGRRRELALCRRSHVTGSTMMCANCTASVRPQTPSCSSSRWLQLSYVGAGVRQAPYAAGSAGQNAYSFPLSLALRKRSFVWRQCALIQAGSAEPTPTVRVKYLVPGQYRPNAEPVRALILRWRGRHRL